MKKLFTFLLALIASVGIASAQSGTCGDNLTWELNTETGILTISGTGAMADYPSGPSVPWYEYRSSIQSVIITDGVTHIGDHAFSNCSSLTSVTIPNSVTSIGEDAFGGCDALTSITIPNSVKSIGKNAFNGCYSLTSVTIPNSVTSIGSDAFYSCSSLKSMIVESGNTVYDSRENCNAIIETATNTLIVGCQNTIIPNSVTSIGSRAFGGCDALTSITIPNSVKSIGSEAFLYCHSLTSVTIGNSVTSIVDNAFRACSSLTSVNVDSNNPNYSSVDGVLFNKDKTTLIQYPIGKQGAYTIPNSVTSIGRCAFQYCSSLTFITIPNSVTSIGDAAFYGCSSLTSVTIPNSVTSIGNYTFQGCSSLTSVTFEGRTPPSIDRDVFYNTNNCPIYVPCGTKEAYVTALNENNTIDESRVIEKLPYTYSILTSDSTLGSVTITQEPTCTEPVIFRADAAEGYQFAQWSDGNTDNPRSLVLTQDTTLTAEFELAQCLIASGECGENLTWELSCDSVLTISGTGAMADYTYNSYAPWYDYRSSIKSVIINDGVTSIGSQAFYYCSKLTSVTIPNSVTSIGSSAFDGCSSLTSITIPNSVKSIGSIAFYGCSSLTSVTIPNSVTSIGSRAFEVCSSLKSMIVESGNTVYDSRENCNAIIETATNTLIVGCQNTIIPNSVTSIEDWAFRWCSSLTSITIPNSVTSIGSSAFDGCSSLTSITIPNSVKSIGSIAFLDCSSLISITIPNGVTSIGDQAFRGCSSLTSITIPNSMTSIGDGAFYECSSLTSITIPNSVTSIERSAFHYCTSLTSITIPNSVTSIGDHAFYGCSSLTSVTIPNSVTSIGSRAFEVCSSLKSMIVESGNTVYDSRENCNAIIETATNTLIVGCQNTIIPNSVTSIEDWAFRWCSSLTSITIPNSVTSIGSEVFYNCYSLTSVTFEGSTPPVFGLDDFYNNFLIYVPCGTKEAYVTALNENNTIDESRVIEKLPYTYSILTSDSTLGSVTITQEPTCTEPVIFRADAAEDYQFTQWSDGNTGNPRLLVLTQDTTITALFEQIVIEQDTIGAPSVKPVTSTEGYDFYVAFMPNGASKPTDKDLKLQLFVNSREANRVRLEYADGSTKDYNVPAGGTTTIDVDPKKAYWEEEKLEEEKILDKGVRVYSLDKKPMTVYSGNQNGEGAPSCFDGAHVLPKEALGQEYVIQSANDDYMATEFVVMSTRPGTTTVTVELNVKSRKGNKDRLTISFKKAKQIYIIRSKSIDPNKPNDVIDLSGSTICADAPVAVWSGNQSAIIPNQAGMTSDHTYDQLLPVNRWGQEFIVPLTGMKMQMNELHIISLKEGTNVTVSGVGASGVRTKAMGALEKWKKVVEAPSGENLLDSVFTITADNPIQVYLYTSSAASNIYMENGLRHFQGDPSMTMISPLEFVTDTTIFSTYEAGNNASKHQLVLWAKQSVLGSLQMNGTAIGSQLTQAVPGMPEYRFARIDVDPGTYTLTAAERGFGGYVYGLGEGQAYLYPAGYTFKPYQDSLSLNDPNQEYPVFRLEWNEKYLNDGGWYLDKEEQKDGTYILDSIRVCDSTELTFPIKMYNEWDHVKWEIIGSIQGSEYFAAEEQYSTATSKPELTHQFLLLPKNENKEPFEDFAVRAVVYHKPIMCDNIKQEKWPKDTLNTTVRVFRACIPYQDTIIVADSTGISDIIPDGQDTIPYVEVQPDGEITIDITDVRIGVITIVTIGTESGQVHPGFGGNYDELENTRVVMEYVLNPFGQTASPDKWYAFAVPFKVDMETGITRKYGNKSHVPGKDFMILEYDSELRSKTGKGWVEKKSGSLTPGHIYMLGIEGNCNRWLFEKKRGAAIVGDKEKDLQHYAHGNSKNDGWHGLGNTTLEYVDMSFDGLNATYVYTYDNQYGRYNIYSIEESILAVGQPFFTQGDNDGSVAFTPNNGKGKGNGKKNMPIYAPSYDVQPSHPRVLLTIETEKINATPDRLYITLHDDNQCGSYRIGRDFMRMDKGSKQVPNFWCPMADGTQLSAHGVTMPTTYTTIPLGIFTPAKGEYTINAHMQDMDDYIVELYCQNICLGTFMHDMPLTLDLTAGTSYDYSIRISRRVSTDLNPAEDTQCDKDNKWYDVLGRPLPQDAHGIFIRKGEKIIK